MLLDILQLTIYGIVIGSIIALGAIGVSLTFGILRFANFAHGDMMTFGAYVAFSIYTVLGLPMWLGLPAAMAATVLLAFALDRVVFIRLRRKNPVVLLIASFGIALMIRSCVQMFWGPETLVYVQGIQLPWKFAGLRLKPDQLTILIAAAVLVFALHMFLTYSRVGKAMRAMADNPDLARISGIDTERIVLWTWGIGAALAAAAGIFLGLDTRLLPEMGWFILLPIFAAAILGGIGKPYGAVAGGLIIGVAQEVSTLFIDPSYKAAVAFAIMVIVLIVRPTGIFSGRS